MLLPGAGPARGSGLAEFEARAAALLDGLGPLEAGADPTSPATGPGGLEFEFEGLDGFEAAAAADPPATAPATVPDFAALDREVARLTGGPGGTRIRQTLEATVSESSYTSTAEGETSTRVAALTHTLVLDRALGTAVDLSLVNTLELGRTRDRDTLEASLVRQLDGAGEWGPAILLEVQRAKNGEVEPDYDLAELSVRRLFDRFPESTLELRAYGRRQAYAADDPFYLDLETTGLSVDGSRHRGRLDATFHVAFDGERFDAAPANDVNRLSADAGLTVALGRLEARASASFQHEAILDPGTLDPWRSRTGELALVQSLGRTLTLEVATGYESRSVDVLSRSNFDYLERHDRALATLDLGTGLDATLTLTRATRENRDKQPGDRIDERADDQDRTDLELYLGWSRGRAVVSLTASRGETRYLHGQTQAFADEDRRALSASLGWTFDDAYRLDLGLSRDRARFPTFPVNGTESDQITLTLTRSF